MHNILLISEAPEEQSFLPKSFATAGIQLVSRPTLQDALPLFKENSPTFMAVIAELRPSDYDDLFTFIPLKTQFPALEILIFSAPGPHTEVFRRLRSIKGLHLVERPLRDPSSQRILSETLLSLALEASKRNRQLTSAGATASRESEAFPRNQDGSQPLYSEEFLRRVGLSDVPVLLHGETGVGKEVMARRLWSYSSRVGKPFLKLNCAALPSELIESELFGYEKGAFTGATVDKPGKFELAQDGTILLDEIGDMDIRLQAKLLQVLQDGEVQPLGSSRTLKVNVRVMAATHRELHSAIAQGNFREDLYYRLSVINITIPPLRERRNEIIPLAEKLLFRHATQATAPPTIPEALQQAMIAHPWPGNVRELENLMRRFLIYQDADLLVTELKQSLLPARRRRATDRIAEAPPAAKTNISIGDFAAASRTAESKLLLDTLEAVRWNRRQAASRLDMDYKAFLYKLQKHGIAEGKTKRPGVVAP